MNPPHSPEHPEPVPAEVWRPVDKVRLIALYPFIGICLAEVPVKLTQLPDEVVCAQALVPLRVFLYRKCECETDI